MTRIRDIINIMESWAPASIAEDWDNPGLIVGNPDTPAGQVLITLDVTERILSLARERGASMIVSHHPPLFSPLKRISDDDMAGRIISAAVKHDIALYASHTNLDQAPGGVSFALADRLNLTDTRFLSPGNADMVKFVTYVPSDHTDSVRKAAADAGAGEIGNYRHCSFTSPGTGTFIPNDAAEPYSGSPGELSREREDRLEMILPAHLSGAVVAAARSAHPYEEMAFDLTPLAGKSPGFGYGVIGTLTSAMDRDAFIRMVGESLGVHTVGASHGTGQDITHVAVMGGSGRRFINHALAAGADAFVTGEIGHHDYLEHGRSLVLVDASHRATELPVLETIRRRFTDSGLTFDREPEIITDTETHGYDTINI
jgi:dinuclear metal center YbgI/SA1388 family protein